MTSIHAWYDQVLQDESISWTHTSTSSHQDRPLTISIHLLNSHIPSIILTHTNSSTIPQENQREHQHRGATCSSCTTIPLVSLNIHKDGAAITDLDVGLVVRALVLAVVLELILLHTFLLWSLSAETSRRD